MRTSIPFEFMKQPWLRWSVTLSYMKTKIVFDCLCLVARNMFGTSRLDLRREGLAHIPVYRQYTASWTTTSRFGSFTIRSRSHHDSYYHSFQVDVVSSRTDGRVHRYRYSSADARFGRETEVRGQGAASRLRDSCELMYRGHRCSRQTPRFGRIVSICEPSMTGFRAN